MSDGAAEQADEADEAFAGTVPRTEVPAHARAGWVGRGHRFAAYPRCWADLGDEARNVRITIFQIRLVHTVIFWILSLCTVYALFSGIADRITMWTWVAVVLLFVESVVLVVSGWKCPLTILAERQGALRGSVTDIFLPKWFADRIFLVCGTMYAVANVLILWRVFR